MGGRVLLVVGLVGMLSTITSCGRFGPCTTKFDVMYASQREPRIVGNWVFRYIIDNRSGQISCDSYENDSLITDFTFHFDDKDSAMAYIDMLPYMAMFTIYENKIQFFPTELFEDCNPVVTPQTSCIKSQVICKRLILPIEYKFINDTILDMLLNEDWFRFVKY